MSDSDIIAVSRGADSFDNELDKLVMTACDEVHASKLVADSMAGFLLNMGVQTEPHVEKISSQFHERIRQAI